MVISVKEWSCNALLFPTGFIQIFGSKIQGFSRLFLLPDSRLSNKLPKETLNNAGTKLFSLQTYGWNWIWPKWKKIYLYIVALKKNWTLYHFSRLDLYFPDFFQVWKFLGKLISRIQDSIQTLSLEWKVAYQIGVPTVVNSFLCQHEKQSGIVFI